MQRLTLVLAACAAVQAYTPVVLWHGMGDSCCNPLSMGHMKRLITSTHEGTYVYSVMIGSNIITDTEAGFFKDVNAQVEEVCSAIAADPQLAGGYHAVGFSQGGQFLRALAQRCPGGMRSLVSLGGQQQGVFGFPNCAGDAGFSLCENLRQWLTLGAYTDVVQRHLVQAQYWHDPLDEDTYRANSLFLADINQENHVNETYKANLARLEKLVLVKFAQDQMVIPRESSWFGFYTPGQDTEVQDMRETSLYTEDRLGLAELDAAGKVALLSVDGDHLQFSDEWFTQNIIEPYLD